MVKVQINEMVDKDAISNNFVGLAKDNEGDVWIFGPGHGISLNGRTLAISGAIKDILDNFGPFTKYNGQVIIEND